MAALKSWKLRIGFLLVLCIFGVIYFGYFYCFGSTCPLKKGSSIAGFKSNYDAYFAGKYLQNQFSENELIRDYNIDLDNEDVIVFLHIQKTGGTTFGKHLVENLEVYPPCNCYKRVKKHCDCLNKKKQVWLFSRYSTGWRCGLHADWTELTNCVDDFFKHEYGGKVKRKYYYITMLRDPVSRFISEWMHVRRGATWKTASLKCNGREATLQEVPFCYDSEDWMDVSLQEFMDCPHNLAFNRQTRMLANLTAVHCYNASAMSPRRRHALLLDSAKRNLRRMAFFGLVEFQAFSQFLFEHSLHMSFADDFVQHNKTHSSRESVGDEDLKRIAELNRLDIELYQYAKDLFLQRVRQAYRDEGLELPGVLGELVSRGAVLERPPEVTVSQQKEGGDSVGKISRLLSEHDDGYATTYEKSYGSAGEASYPTSKSSYRSAEEASYNPHKSSYGSNKIVISRETSSAVGGNKQNDWWHGKRLAQGFSRRDLKREWVEMSGN